MAICGARLVNGLVCMSRNTEIVWSSSGEPVELCSRHRSRLAEKGSVELTDWRILSNLPIVGFTIETERERHERIREDGKKRLLAEREGRA